MYLETGRLKLRMFEEKDFEDTFEIYKNDKICEYLLHYEWDEKNAEKNYKEKLKNRTLDKNNTLNIAVEYNQKVIGDINVFHTGMKDCYEIGYAFNFLYHGKGLAKEALKNVLKYLFEELKAHRVQAVLDKRNEASEKLCKKLGMRKEGDFKKDYWNKDEWTDTLIYGILEEEYFSR